MELFFHESIRRTKMNTGGELIWTRACRSPSLSLRATEKWSGADRTIRTAHCGHVAAEALILHNHTNSSLNSHELFTLSYGLTDSPRSSFTRPVVIQKKGNIKISDARKQQLTTFGVALGNLNSGKVCTFCHCAFNK